MENKLKNLVRCSLACFAFSMEKFLSVVRGEEKNSAKKKGGWRTYPHKNKHKMENISPHTSTYLPTSDTNELVLYFCYRFPSYYQADPRSLN